MLYLMTHLFTSALIAFDMYSGIRLIGRQINGIFEESGRSFGNRTNGTKCLLSRLPD